MFNYMCIYTSLHQEHVITSSIHTFNLYTKFFILRTTNNRYNKRCWCL